MLEISEVRKRLLQAVARARQDAAARRAEADAAERDYARFLDEVAGPVVRQFAGALKAEGYPFQIATPAGVVRLVSERSHEDFIEIALDASDRPVVVGRTSRGRGRRVVTEERPLGDRAAIAELGEEDVLAFLLAAIQPFVAR